MVSESSIKILIVDDEELLRNSLGKFLERKGFVVEMAESGNKAFAITESHSFDLIISDVRMPDGDGPYLLSLLKEKGGDIPPVMFMTGYDDLTEEEMKMGGALQVFNKPIDRQEILTQIKEHFQIS